MKYKKVEYVYIHIPFCLKKCDYCSFFSVDFSEKNISKYIDNLKQEIQLFHKKFSILPKTIYFGGGTPSLLNSDQINSILKEFSSKNLEEITLEANPNTLSIEKIQEIKKTNINRLSLGVQSFKDSELQILGRIHNAEKVEKVFNLLRKNEFNNISLDLIYGLPNQKITDLDYSLKKLVELNPEHISTYCLSLEEDVTLFKKKDKIPEDSIIEKFYFRIKDYLEEKGYKQYEISNFSKIGKESKHNLSYWENKNYLGIGAAASGYIENFRYSNPANLKKYFSQLKKEKICQNKEILSKKDLINEFIFLQMRKLSGIDLNEFQKKFKINLLELKKNEIANLKRYNKIILTKNNLRLSREGLFVSNYVFSELII